GFSRSVDADYCVELDCAVGTAGSILSAGLDMHGSRGLAVVELPDAGDIEDLGAVEAKRLGRFALRELQRDDAHANQIGAVDAFERLGNDGPHPEQSGPLGCPVA